MWHGRLFRHQTVIQMEIYTSPLDFVENQYSTFPSLDTLNFMAFESYCLIVFLLCLPILILNSVLFCSFLLDEFFGSFYSCSKQMQKAEDRGKG